MRQQWFLIVLLCASMNTGNGQNMNQKKNYRIRIQIGEESTTASLFDNPTTRDFIQLLPLKMELKDYAGTEKIFYLPKKLSTNEAPAGSRPSAGDITYYAPWGNLALFYKDFSYSPRLITLGKFDNNVELLRKPESMTISVEVIQD